MRFKLRARLLYWPSVVLAGITLILVVANIFFASNNHDIQVEINQRQQFINQSIQLSRVNDVLVRMLANASVSAKDDKIRELLVQQGITVTVAPNTNSGTQPPTVPSGTTTPAAGSGTAAPAAGAPATSDKK